MNKPYYLLCLLLILFVGCDQNEESNDEPIITPEITIPSGFTSLELDSDQTSQTITFTATTQWSIALTETTKSTLTWLSVSPMSGSAGSATLSLSLDENESNEERSAEITISSDGVEKSISVTQNGSCEDNVASQLDDLIDGGKL